MVSRDTTRPDPTGQHVINIELFPCLLEQDILPSIFSRLSEKQLVDLDTYDFTTKITVVTKKTSRFGNRLPLIYRTHWKGFPNSSNKRPVGW